MNISAALRLSHRVTGEGSKFQFCDNPMIMAFLVDVNVYLLTN
jgi:hypothetical protein